MKNEALDKVDKKIQKLKIEQTRLKTLANIQAKKDGTRRIIILGAFLSTMIFANKDADRLVKDHLKKFIKTSNKSETAKNKDLVLFEML
ncbi:MAG: hypothetical protein HRU28_12725 [Rhizobiales bacterium]|nr:hypothetical protein [Hyphomicrobiales bacterium]